MNSTTQNTQLDVDSIILKLLSVRKSKLGTNVNLSEQEIKALITTVQEILKNQPMLLHLKAPLSIAGIDFHHYMTNCLCR